MNDNLTLQSSGCLFFIPRSGFPFTGHLNVNGTLLCQDVSFWNLWTLAPLIYILRVGFSPNVLFTVFLKVASTLVHILFIELILHCSNVK